MKDKAEIERREIQIELMKLYASSRNISEFLIKKDLLVPEASWIDVLGCKMHWFKKNHEDAWYRSWFMSLMFLPVIFGSIAVLVAPSSIPLDCIAAIGVASGLLSWMIALILFLAMFGEKWICIDSYINHKDFI